MSLLPPQIIVLLRSKIFSWSALLAVSAFVSKLCGLWRDRLLVQFFAESQQLDLVFAAFRIPDFFFFLLISGTVATLFLPRYADLKSTTEQQQFFQSFLGLFITFFGVTCVAGILGSPLLAQLFSPGLDPVAQSHIASLSRYLFGSVFLLCVSSVFSARLQAENKFWSIALAPIVYMLGLCLGLLVWHDSFGLIAVGYGAMAGAGLHLAVNGLAVQKLKIKNVTLKNKPNPPFSVFHFPFSRLKLTPQAAWKNFRSDFFARVINGSAIQINQTIDIVIASFLLPGSIAAFSLGTTLGHFLLSIIGFSVANVLFPALSQHKHQWKAQSKLLKKGTGLILGITIPASLLAWGLSEWLLETFLTLSGEKLRLTNQVFTWTVASLPAACLVPLLSRYFLANDDTHTSLRSTVLALATATSTAAILSLWVFSPDRAIVGLAIGNFIANYLNAGVLLVSLYWQPKKTV